MTHSPRKAKTRAKAISSFKTTPDRKGIQKAVSGIAGFDEITQGGLPSGRTTLLMGGPGSGKTLFALQFLVHGARHCNEPGIFVALEEPAHHIIANARSFGWELESLQRKNLSFLDGTPVSDTLQLGDFDLCGLLAALDAKVRDSGARRIVLDAIDVLLVLLPDAAAKRREIYRVHEWLLTHGLTAVVTLKSGFNGTDAGYAQPHEFMQFMVDCTIVLTHRLDRGISQRNLRVQKYRGSSFDENESAFLIGKNGYEIAAAHTFESAEMATCTERVSSGIQELDAMLDGGYFRNASILITGFSGSAKTTLSAAFAEAACKRNEKTLFVCFQTSRAELLRNLASVGIDLTPYVEQELLYVISARTIVGSAVETYLARIKAFAEDVGARCVVIDPVSAWSKPGNDLTAQTVAYRLVDWAKMKDITLLCTSFMDEMSDPTNTNSESIWGPSLEISALVDTWISLSYLVQAGERNRGLSIIKSRGTAHSRQIRELILSDSGVTLSDPCTADGSVLIGSLRWQREHGEVKKVLNKESEERQALATLATQVAELEAHLQSIIFELAAKKAQQVLLAETVKDTRLEDSETQPIVEKPRRATKANRGRQSDDK